MGRRLVADEKEVMKHCTDILRMDADCVKAADKLKAAEFITKHYSREEEIAGANSKSVVIIDDIFDDVELKEKAESFDY